MSVSRCPFRFRRRFALIIAMMASITSTERSVRGQSVGDPSTVASAVEPTTSTFSFSPLERILIRQSVRETPLPPEIAARRSEIERKSLERIFSRGMIVAWAPQETVLPKLPSQDKMIDAGILDQPSSLPNPPLVSDRMQRLPKPVNIPAIKPPQPMMPVETLPGMIEDDSAIESPYRIESKRPIETLLPNYALPGGGLDVFRLAPSRFGRPLPNAR